MNLLIRLLLIYLRAKRRPRCALLAPQTLEFAVQPTDLDLFLHMNNGRYFSIMDLGRLDLFIRTGLLDALKKEGFSVTVAAETLRFRRSLKLFQRFILETRILGWDEKSILLEQRFLRQEKTTEWEVVAHGAVRTRLISAAGLTPSTAFLRVFGLEFAVPPPLPAWVAEWDRQCQAQNVNVKVFTDCQKRAGSAETTIPGG